MPASVYDETHIVTSKVKQDNVLVGDTDTTSSVQFLFLYLIDQVHKLLQNYKLKVIKQCKSLRASDVHKINLFSDNQIKKYAISY